MVALQLVRQVVHPALQCAVLLLQRADSDHELGCRIAAARTGLLVLRGGVARRRAQVGLHLTPVLLVLLQHLQFLAQLGDLVLQGNAFACLNLRCCGSGTEQDAHNARGEQQAG